MLTVSVAAPPLCSRGVQTDSVFLFITGVMWAECCQTFYSNAAPEYVCIAGLYFASVVVETLMFP